jgi:hypothetical protein
MMQDDRYLDDAIDRTVRDMMDVDPAAGLTRRVLAKIDEPMRGRVLTFPRLAAITAFAAAAVVLAIAMLLHTSPRDSGQLATTTPPPPRAVNPPVANAVPSPSRPTPPPPTPTRTLNPSHPATAVDRHVEAASIASENDVVIAPLDAMEPIRFAPIGRQTIVVTTIGMDPIQISPLRMDPLSSTPQ